MIMSNNLPSPFEVWRLAFYFDDKPEVFKYLPVVILDINSDTGEVLVAGAKVTSPPPRTDCPGEVALQHWKEAGLLTPSVVRCTKIAQFYLSDFDGCSRYGRLSKDDEIAVTNALTKLGYFGRTNTEISRS